MFILGRQSREVKTRYDKLPSRVEMIVEHLCGKVKSGNEE